MITGDDIRVARIRRKHMTQGELARKVGVSLRTITGWENGATIPPKQQEALADVLGIGGVAPQVRGFVDPASELSDVQLIAELARRLSMVRSVTTQPTGGGLRSAVEDQLRDQEVVTSQFGNVGINGSNEQPATGQTTERKHRPVGAESDNGVIGGEQVVFSAARGTGSDRHSGRVVTHEGAEPPRRRNGSQR